MSIRMIFGGTTEGRKLSEEYLSQGDEVVVCVTTEHGASLLPEETTCYSHPMEMSEMADIARKHGARELIDATHPFAVHASQNIRACAEALKIRYVRVERTSNRGSDFSSCVSWVDAAEDAAARLAGESGAVLLTTGSSTLPVYASAIHADRLYARVLPTHGALRQCEQAGILPAHIIAMQGPFSEELNGALYDQFAIRHIVSKDSGDVGGVKKKIMPALKRNLNVILIKRSEISRCT